MLEQLTPPPFEPSGLPLPSSQPESFGLPNAEVFNSRNEKVFGPYNSSHTEDGEEESYDYLLSKEELPTRSVEDAVVRTPEGRGVETDQSKKYSMDILNRFESETGLDSKIKEIIGRYNEGNSLASDRTMHNIRNNKYLRMELGSYFLSKLNSMKGSLPPRVARNEQKNSNVKGYRDIPNLRSREYASLLALAHLDGTFDPDKSASERSTYDKLGNVTTGQHRAACEMLLFW